MDKRNSRRRPKMFFLIWLFLIAMLPPGCEKKPAPQEDVPRPVKLMELPASGFYRDLSLPASVKALHQAELSFLVPGRLETIDIVRGQTVRKGQTLATLDPRDYQNRLNAAKADTNQKKIYLERIRRAMKKGAATETEEELALADFQVAESRMKIQEKALGDTILKAPFAGEIGRQYRENFQDVAAKEKVFLLQDISKIKIVIDVSESIRMMVVASGRSADGGKGSTTVTKSSETKPDIDKLKGRKSSAVAIFDDLPGQSFPLTFYEEDQAADPDTRTYAVTFLMDAPIVGLILPGMSATVKGRFKVKTAAGQNAYTIPAGAVFSGPDAKRYVWVYTPANKGDSPDVGTVHKKEVKVGSLQGNQIEIIGDFKDGSKIATSGVHYLTDGMKVKPLTFKAQRDAE